MRFATPLLRRSALPLVYLLTSAELIAQDQPATRSTARAAAASALRDAPVKMVVALVTGDMTVRPVPLHALELRPAEDSTATPALVRTGLDGTLTTALRPGRYVVRSVQPAVLGDSTYRWVVPFTVSVGGAAVELTNANAAVTGSERPRTVTRHVAPEREAFERVKRGVFRVEAGLGHGTGFLVNAPGVASGLVVTNDHVVAQSGTASVYLDSVTRVPAQVVLRDREADLALLRIPATRCTSCPRLPLATLEPGEPLVVAGERVFAIGFPLSQEMTFTTGVASSVRDGAIISDVNINPGNSGGPMLTSDGKVVGINTFGDDSPGAGPGVAGAVAVTRLMPLLAQAPASLAGLPELEDRLLPVVPRAAYPLALLKAHADTAEPSEYRKLLERSAGKFTVTLVTPVTRRVQARLAEQDVASDRRKRERRGGVSTEEQYSEVNQERDWEQYVGDYATPVIAVIITPKLGETFGSALTRGLQAGLAGYSTAQANFKFQGDVRGARFYRNGVEVEPLRGGHGPQTIRVENQWVKMKDVADMGYYVLPATAFAPDSDGTPSRLSIVVQDLKNPSVLSATDIDGRASARMWNDFGPYFQAVPQALSEGESWRAADPSRKTPSMPLRCDPATATCTRVEAR